MILSEDLRKRAIEAVTQNNMKITAAAKTFQIGRRTLHTWLHKYKNEGVTAAKTGYQKGHSHKITDFPLFRTFVEKNSDCTATEMAARWEKETNQKVSPSTILRMLKKSGFTFKKKLLITSKQMKRSVKNL